MSRLTEKQARDYLVKSSKGNLQTSSVSKIGRGGIGGNKTKASYQVGRGDESKGTPAVTPADQSAAQTRSEVSKDFSPFYGKPSESKGVKRKAKEALLTGRGDKRRKTSKKTSKQQQPKKKKSKKQNSKKKVKKSKKLVYNSSTLDIWSPKGTQHV